MAVLLRSTQGRLDPAVMLLLLLVWRRRLRVARRVAHSARVDTHRPVSGHQVGRVWQVGRIADRSAVP